MKLTEEKGPIENDLPENIRMEVSSFPSMPQAAVKLRSVLKEDDVSIVEIENILRQDPGLSTNVLRLANSAYFGVSSKVGSLKKAVMLLGIKRFAQIAVSAGMSKTMGKAVEGYDLSPGELWLHSIAVSNTAEALAKNNKIDETNDVFIPALLHDMGKLILGEFVKEELHQIESIAANGVPLVIAENMVLGTDHAEIGAQILANWSFPIDIVNAVRWHHSPESIKNSKLQPEIVYLSNLACQSQGDSDSVGDQFDMPSSKVLQRMGIKIDQYEMIADKAHSWQNKLSDTLSFD